MPRTTLLYQWPRPDGLPYGAAAWASATRMLSSFRMHWDLTAGWWPTQDVTYRTPASWLPAADDPARPVRRPPLPGAPGQAVDSRILAAAVAATGYGPASTVTRPTTQISRWLFARLAARCSTPPTT